jgi:sugar transferase (PEP-CTERM/EpsH1 system associated)
MKILVVSHRFPYPPTSGAKIRAFHMIRHLSANHQVTVASLVRTDAEADDATGIAKHCAAFHMQRVSAPIQALRMVSRVPTSIPSSFGYFYSGSLRRRIRTLLERQPFDLIVAHSSSVSAYVEDVSRVPKIMDFCDMDSQKWLEYARYKHFPSSVAYRVEGSKLEREEKRIARLFDMCTVATRAEAGTLERFATGALVDWFPNGVDSEYFAPSMAPHDPDALVFVGRMDYFPNVECMQRFCAEVLPRVRSVRPRTTLSIVGADPTRDAIALGRLPGVTVTGTVPDVRPYLHRAALMVAPLNIARGTQNKILEGMATGLPVVTSPVAAGGVDAIDSEHVLVARTPDEQASAILHVLSVPAERRRLAGSARARILSHHAWDRAMQRLDGIIDRCVARYATERR